MHPMTLEQVVRAYADTVYRLAFARMRDPADADDVFQDVFLRYAEKAPVFRDEEHRKAWLIRVTINRCNSHYRSGWFRRILPMEAAANAHAPAPPEPGLDEALARLSPSHRTLLHLYYYENYDCAAIAEALGQSPSSVRAGLTRARRALGKLLEGERDDV